MKHLSSYLIIVSAITIFSFDVLSQEISGRVTNIKEEPIAFANVILLLQSDSTFISGTVTDENGFFSLSHSNDNSPGIILKISFLGYETKYINFDEKNNLGAIILNESTLKLKEFVVTANKPIFKSIGGSIITDVMGSILSKEHSMNDLLLKIPGLINIKGNIEVFGKGNPTYYLNGRKIENIDEVSAIDVKDIKSVELITNPNSRYDAETKAVIKIITLKKNDGFSYTLRVRGIQSKYFSTNESVTVSYVKNRFNSTAYYGFYDYYGQSTQYATKKSNVDTIWKYVTDGERIPKAKRHYYRFSLDYEFNPKHIVGLQIGGSYIRQKEKANEINQIIADNKPFLNFKVISWLKTTTNNMQTNLFYKSKWNENLSSDFNLDYIRYTAPREQITEENYTNEQIITNMNSDNKIDIYAGEYIIDYSINDKNRLLMGVNGSFINGYGNNNIIQSKAVNKVEYKNKENRIGCFVDYGIKLGKISLNTGLRYENVRMIYNDVLNNSNNVNRTYQKIFPSFNISYSVNSLNNSLTFSSKTERPPLSFLNGQMYYQNQFMYQTGNPLLIPQTSYILEWTLGFKSVNFKVSYTRIDDYISAIFKQNSNNDSKIVSSWDNFDKADFFKTNINYQNTFWKFWNTSVTIGLVKPFFESIYLGNVIKYNKMTLYLANNNYFRLPSNFIFSLNYYLNTGGSDRIFTSEFFNTIDVGIQKSFFKDQLSLNLKCSDIFRGLIYEQTAKINNFSFHQKEQYSEWNFSIDLIYRFNQQNTKYRGKSAAKDESNRL